jgi:hypothetical protein
MALLFGSINWSQPFSGRDSYPINNNGPAIKVVSVPAFRDKKRDASDSFREQKSPINRGRL